MERESYAKSTVPSGRVPVKTLLNAPPLLQCKKCQHISQPGDLVLEGRSTPFGWMAPTCDYPDRCLRTRRGLPRTEPVNIRVTVKHVTCSCCQQRLSGRQTVHIQGSQIFHASHAECAGRCQERRAGVSA
jgi:hypothetical protein